MCDAVRSNGAVPVVSGVAAGAALVGLDDETLERFLTRGATKVSARDLGHAIVSGADGATTVAASLAIAEAAGIEVFATGGIGGVHRRSDPLAPVDESADLAELARARVITVCAGAKSILDLPATLERLETHGVPVIGFGTHDFPGFFTATSGLRVPARADSVDAVAAAVLAAKALGRMAGLLVVQPPPAGAALDAALVESAVAQAVAGADAADIRGAALTPFLLAAVERATGGASLRANLALLAANAALAARIAVALRAASRGN